MQDEAVGWPGVLSSQKQWDAWDSFVFLKEGESQLLDLGQERGLLWGLSTQGNPPEEKHTNNSRP